MFLAINELIKEKSRFILITCVVVLVSYLAFFLTALAYGLATSYTQGIEKWSARGIIMQEDANNNLARSLLVDKDYSGLLSSETALIGLSSATVSAEESEDVSIFGIENGSFLLPTVIEGRPASSNDEVVVADDLQKAGVKLGQEIAFKGSEKVYRVAGFTDGATYQTAPIVYMDIARWRELASDIAGMSGMRDDTTVSGVIVRNNFDITALADRGLAWQSVDDYIYSLPGYQAQVLTFSTMIGFLIAIASFVLAIFMYILTLQKKGIFGVMKAEGVPNSYIARSVLLQTVLLSAIGMLCGLLLTLGSGLLLSSVVPFLVQPLFFAAIIGLFLLCGIIGAIASVRAVTKIDPVEAIG